MCAKKRDLRTKPLALPTFRGLEEEEDQPKKIDRWLPVRWAIKGL